jgi:hypothetical protein
MTRNADHNSWLDRLRPLSRNPEPQPARADPAYPVPPSRRNKTTISTWQDSGAAKQLKALAFETGKSQQALIAEALNLLFKEYDKPPIAS